MLSTDHRQRIRISRSLIASLVYVSCVVLTGYSAANGIVEPGPVVWLQAGLVGWTVLIYACLRSGFSLRFSDPALTLIQIMGAQVWIAASYVTCPPLRGSLMMLLALVLVFGIFSLNALERKLTSLYTLVLMGGAMAWMAHVRPQDYPAKIEIAHFILMATILPVVSLLGALLADIRSKLRHQKQELKQALARIQEMAIRDDLTGLHNRRHMGELLVQQVKQAERAGRGFSLCILDLDHFKQINDSFGHGVGDEVLRSFADLARRKLRETDALARWGGEEFLLLMPDTTVDQALLVVQRMRAGLTDLHVADTLPELRLTFSAGLTEFQFDEALETTIERADRLLYQAKSEGRNCTRAASRAGTRAA
ncbi:MAG: GGDEF domain-containing protein [Aquabacterium sp.]|nr:MAG: GGDEF domain-containing protein [Aquabacterium sp.]